MSEQMNDLVEFKVIKSESDSSQGTKRQKRENNRECNLRENHFSTGSQRKNVLWNTMKEFSEGGKKNENE